MSTSQPLNESQIKHFLEHGWIRIDAAFSRESAGKWTENIWERLDMDPNDKTTWVKEWINLPSHRTASIKEFAPKAWDAIGQLVGGHGRISSEERSRTWNDGIIVNLGREEYTGRSLEHNFKGIPGSDKQGEKKNSPGWHCDGDFFLHFLDSPEQALLVVPLFSDIAPGGGGTLIAPESIGKIARALMDHPEGIRPTEFEFSRIRDECVEFVELTGQMGDVILMHPFMLHAASPNILRQPRFITNPAVAMAEPFQFSRSDPKEYSLVEIKTIKSLGGDMERGIRWERTAPRQRIVPERVKRQEMQKMDELRRLGQIV